MIRPITILATLACLGGCTSTPSIPPPVVNVKAHSTEDPRMWVRGQGIAVDNRVITAAHLVTKSSGTTPPSSLRVNGVNLRVRSPMHGNLSTVLALYQSGKMTSPDAITQDWFCFQVDMPHEITRRGLSFDSPPPRPGERLYAVRVDPELETDEYSFRALEVVEADFEDTPMPDRIVTVRLEGNEKLPGWSGCFVGRYVPRQTPPWQFIGILVGQVEIDAENACILVIRPPAEAIAWLKGKPAS